MEVEMALATGHSIPRSSGYLINGELGDFANCSNETTHRWQVDYGKTYLLRIVNAVVDDELFFAIGGHNLTIIGVDAAYVKPFTASYILISPGQTMDVLITTDRPLGHYYMASRQYKSGNNAPDLNIGSAIIEYAGEYNFSQSPVFPNSLPDNADSVAAINSASLIRSLGSEDYPVDVPRDVNTRMFIVVSMGELCTNRTNCNVTAANKRAASMNNISWTNPTVDILKAYYRNLSGYYTADFPEWPPIMYNFTANLNDPNVYITDQGTKVKVLEYNESVEVVFQGSSIKDGSGVHPMHMHGYSFHVVGMGYGIFNNETDPLTYNLVDPPKVNTFIVPKDGWLAIRFTASNPGVWIWHCHLDGHFSRGMATVFIVKNGDTKETSLRPPPSNMPRCTGLSNMHIRNWNNTIRADANEQYF
ncbi:hypothetical protein SAY86_002824 [Trapa natans]|uniref:laccase n=1 Tax=Trapa natans TaxID=22666 RepID=A0AAN7LII8_TRANT|nr:hypothetical protein SAY86_002824 [Trapa natans]